MLKKILLVIALVIVIGVVGICVLIGLQPSTFAVERSAVIAAPRADVFAQVNDLQAWDGWSPWKDLDPNPKTSISSPSAGKGATFTWNGNDEIGEGTLTILESKPDEMVELEQAFTRPMQNAARMTFTLLPQGDGTKVTWRMHGENDFTGKAVCLLMDMDGMIGPKFEQGLANIRTRLEKKQPESCDGATKEARRRDGDNSDAGKDAVPTPVVKP